MGFFKSRMAKLRDGMKRSGMRQISIWVPKEQADWLRELFSRIGENTVDGHFFRNFLNPILYRRRAPGRRFPSNFLNCEIDGAYIGVGQKNAPIGGRIFNFTDTLIELSPIEAQELESELDEAIGRILTNFVKKNSLSGKIRNTTSVITDKHFLRDVELDIMNDESFERSESRTIQGYTEYAYSQGQPIIQDESIYKFLGFWNAPSRCQIVEDKTTDGDLFVAFIHIRYAGTSPTNMIEELCDEIKRTRYPDTPAANLTWLDVYPEETLRPGTRYHNNLLTGDCWEMDLPRINQVTFEGAKFSAPTWSTPEDLPDSTRTKIHEAICCRIDKEAQAHFEILGQERRKKNLPALHFVMPKEVREGYGKHYVDVLFESTPEVRLVIALIPASPAGMGRNTEPLLAFSRPGGLDFRSQPELGNLAKHWPCLRILLEKDTYSWDDAEFREVCKLAGIGWEQAQKDFEGQEKS
jgi:hypothetical protein